MCNGEFMGKDHTLEFVYMTRWRFKVSAQIFNATQYSTVQYIIIWLTDFACCDWSIPGP